MVKPTFALVQILVCSSAFLWSPAYAWFRIFNLNVGGLSYFEGERPEVDGDGFADDFDLNTAFESYKSYLAENYPNTDLFLEADAMLAGDPEMIMALLHPASAKLARLQGIAEYIKEQKFDAVFLQSVWYRQDYDMIKDCLEDLYWVSDFDKNCPSVEEESDQQVLLGCNGLMTLAIKETCAGRTGIVDQKSIELDKGSPEDAAAEVDISLYFYYTYIPKVQIMDFWYKDNIIRLINAAFAPTSAIGSAWSADQNRQLRVEQANTVCKAAKSPGFFDVAILATGLNDNPDSEPYEKLINCGFIDALEDNWEATFNADDNTNSPFNGYDDEQIIDYVMAMTNPVYSASFIQDILFDKAEVVNHVIEVIDDSGEEEEMSISPHNAIEACLSFIYG